MINVVLWLCAGISAQVRRDFFHALCVVLLRVGSNHTYDSSISVASPVLILHRVLHHYLIDFVVEVFVFGEEKGVDGAGFVRLGLLSSDLE